MVPDIARVKSIFLAAVERYSAEQWPAYLDEACGEDAALRERVEELLRAHGGQKSLDVPAPSQPVETIDQPSAERPGTIIGPYKILEQIGEGGMGVVYVAEQSEPVRRKVALKVIKPGMDTRQVIARFEAERQALAMMDHPNIAKIFDGGVTESGRPYFVMELVRGLPITEYCDHERLSVRRRLDLFVLVCRAVQHAHQKGVIHRDLKPSNILVTLHDGVPVPKVIDFGVAKATGQSLTEKTVYTSFTQLVGTPIYMSPEQVELSGLDIDTRSDIYSLGVLLYELLTGTTPFDSDALRRAAFDEMRRIIREDEPPTPSTRLSTLGAALTATSMKRSSDPRRLDRSVRGELDWIVMKALEKDRTRRYESANDFASDVMRYLTDRPVEACPPSARYRLRKLLRRNRGPVAAGSALAALLLLGTVGTSIGLVGALRAEHRATMAAERARTAEVLATDRLLDVTKEKERATAAEAKAKEEAAIAEAVSDFLQNDLLAQADPEQNARNKKVTVEELLGRAAARIEGKFAQQPRIEAAIRQTIGNTYRALSNYSAAWPHLERAWALYRSALGEEDLNSLYVLNDLARLYGDQGQLHEAEPLFVKVLEVRRRVLGEENPDTLDSMTNLAEAYRRLDQHSKAEPLFVKVLEVRRRVLGEENPHTLIAMNNLAVHYLAHRQYSDAQPLLAKVLEVRRRDQGDENPYTLTAMNNLSEVYLSKGEYLKAEELLATTLEISRRVRGENHELTLEVTNNLARAYWLAKKLDRSIPLFEEVVPKFLAHFGPDHHGTINAMANLGTNYRDAGRLPEAIAKLEQACELERKRNVSQADPHAWLHITRQLVDAYDRAGQFVSSEPLYREALEAERKHHGEASVEASGALAPLGLNLLKQQKYTDAEPFLRECLKIREQIAPDNWATFNTNAMLGGSLLGQKKYTEAEPLLLSGYEGMKQREEKIPIQGKVRLTEALERLVQLYDARGQKEKADGWRKKLPVAKSAKPAETKND